MNEFRQNTMNMQDPSWRIFLKALDDSLRDLEKDLDESDWLSKDCRDEWCTANNHVLDELSNALFSIHEPRSASVSESRRIKLLKRRVHELYARSKGRQTVTIH